jgi:4,5-DOPA dioxygenase extradiol
MPANLADTSTKMPALFMGHGSPMNAIEDNEFSRVWGEIGRALPKPTAILCISAHWETRGTAVTAMSQPKTIHDFGGFPRALFEYQYPAPGSPELAQLVKQTVLKTEVALDESWGLDHGAWSVLTKMFPESDIPVVQFSLDQTKEPAYHYALGKELAALRYKGVLILGSGNIVHNLGMLNFQGKPHSWANEFDEAISQAILAKDHASLINYQQFGLAARYSVPTNEHYLPLLYIIAQQDETSQVRFLTEGITLGSLSMRSVWID